ncbi:leucine-rich repeat protein [Acetobacterium malicum]|nr:leucine-rich repeat protein [Acetobacterium malicum]
MILVFLGLPATALAADNPPGVAYRGHIQDFGDYPTDGSWVDSPAIIGTVGQSKRIEGFEIKLTGTVPEGMELRYNVHVQNKGWLYDENDSADWPKDGAYAGTRGNSLRIEAVKIVLTDSEGKPVGGYAVQYRGHVQNVGDLPADDSQWLADGEQLGTVGSSLRLEALLVQVVKTGQKDADLSDYTALLAQLDQLSEADYTAPSWAALQSAITAHPVTVKNSQTEVDAAVAAIQVAYNKLEKKTETDLSTYTDLLTKIEKLKQADYTEQSWVALQTVLTKNLVTAENTQAEVDAAVAAIQVAYDKLEKKNVPVEPVVYDQVGTYGPKQGSETIVGDVMVAADGVILQNLVIAGSLTISEAVGSGTVTLNNVTVEGDTLVRGGGVHSIKINGGQYRRIIMEKTASGAVRIVATGVDGLEVVVAENASGEAIILEGSFASVTVNAPNMRVTTQGNTTTIGTMTVGVGAGGSTVTVAAGTTVSDLVLDGKAAVKGQGTVAKATVKVDGVVFDKKPGTYTVAPGVVIPPVFPTPDSGGGSGGYNPPGPVAVTAVSLNKTSLELSVQGTETLTATVAPASAANKAVSFSSSAPAVATVNAGTGLVTAVAVGTARITVTTTDGSKQASCDVTVSPIAVTGVSLTPATLNLGYEDTATLTATMAPANATNPGITWSSSDPLVATVDQSGMVKAVHAGTAEITASSQADSTITATTVVTVQGRLSIKQAKAVAGFTDNYVFMLLEGDTFKGGSSFFFYPGTTSLVLGSPSWDSSHYSLGFNNTAAPGTLTLQATGLTSGINSTTVSVTVPDPVTTFANMDVDDTTASFSWPALSGATAVTLEQQKSGESSWTPASCDSPPDSNATSATVKDLLPATTYQFRLLVTDGQTPGVSNSVTVKTKPVATTVSLNKSSADLIMGNTLTLTATVLPADAVNTTVSWTSDKPEFATVDQNGQVTPVAPGTAVITATTANNLTASCTVTVKPVFAATTDDNTATISVYNGTETNVVIPETIDNKPVTAIGANAFSGKYMIQNVTIPATVTSIGTNAFYKTGLTGVTIPATVTSIGANAFYECLGLTTLTFSGTPNLQTIGARAFRGCVGLSSVVIPSEVTSIGEDAFMQCKLSSLTFAADSKLQTIGNLAFYGCSDLASVTIPNSVTSISYGAFKNCAKLTNVSFATTSKVTTIGNEAFAQSGLTSIELPDSLTSLGSNAFINCVDLLAVTFTASSQIKSLTWYTFSGCSKLNNVILPPGLTEIGTHAFFNCAALGQLTIPATVSSIGANAFSGCPSTLVLRFDGNAPGSVDSMAIPAGTTIEYWEGKTSFTDPPWTGYPLKPRNISLTQTDVTINTASFNFDAQGGATEVKLQQKIHTGSTWTDAITTEALTSASTNVIATGLEPSTSYDFQLLVTGGDTPGPSKVVNLNTLVAVTGITLNKTSLELSANGSETLTATVTPEAAVNKNLNWTTSNADVATVDGAGLVTAKSAGTVTITAAAADRGVISATCTVMVLPYETSGTDQLTITRYLGNAAAVSIPATIGGKPVVAIGAAVFKNNWVLTAVTIPSTVTSIGEEAFYFCEKMNAVDINEGTSDLVIGKNAFYSNVNLTTITLPKNLVRLEEKAFYGCEKLATVNFVTDCRLTSIAKDGFSRCSLTSIALPDQLQTIGEYAFYSNSLTGALTIPSAVTAIGKWAFYDQALTTITLPDGVSIDGESPTMGTNGAGFQAAYSGGGAGTYHFTTTWTKIS